MIKADTLFHNFRSESVLAVNKETLDTLNVTFNHYPHLQSDNKFKIQVINWILTGNNLNNSKCFSELSTANILTRLILKQWPDDNLPVSKKQNNNQSFGDIERTYFVTYFEDLILPPIVQSVKKSDKLNCVDNELFDHVTTCLKEIAKMYDFTGNVEISLNVTVLLFNFVSELLQLGLIDNLEECKCFKLFKLSAGLVFSKIDIGLKKDEHRNVERITGCMRLFRFMLGSRVSEEMGRKLREMAPEGFIRGMFLILNKAAEDGLYFFQIFNMLFSKLEPHARKLWERVPLIISCARGRCHSVAHALQISKMDYIFFKKSKPELTLSI